MHVQSYVTITIFFLWPMKKNHYREVTAEVCRIMGENPQEFCYFWMSPLSKLLMHSWYAMQFSADCCTNCEATRILGQIIRGVNQDDLQCKLLEKGESITLGSSAALLRNAEAAAKQSSNLKTGDPTFIQATRKSQ